MTLPLPLGSILLWSTASVFPRLKAAQPWGALAAIACSSGLWLVGTAPASAHEIEVSAEVAATLHMDPSDHPKSGIPTLAWFALTRQGGRLIPLEQCACTLAVYSGSSSAGTPILRPTLTATTAEQYQGIPGATLTFPRSGEYTLVLSGRPRGSNPFQPFELKYPVTVTAGSNPAPTDTPSRSTPSPRSSPDAASSKLPTSTGERGNSIALRPWVLGALALVSVGWVLQLLARRREK